MTTVELTPEFIETELRGFAVADRWVVPVGPHSVTLHRSGDGWAMTGMNSVTHQLSAQPYWCELMAAFFAVGRWTGEHELRSRVEGVLNR